jgi:glucose-6-phosphate isomerase
MAHCVTLDLGNLSADAVGEHGLDAAALDGIRRRAAELRERLNAERDQGMHAYLRLPGSADVLEGVLRVAHPRLGHYCHLVLLGIGGSALGLRMLADALAPAAPGPVHLHVVDNTDPALFARVLARVDLRETLFVVVSKSGGTLEVVAALGFFAERLRREGLPLADHVVAVTDPERGPLRAFAREHDLDCAEIPPAVGGRFSVLSAAGLLPAALLHLDPAALLRGAERAVKLCTSGPAEEDWPALLGLSAVELCRRGKTGLVFMPYSSRLRGLAEWFVQLWDESLGKDGAGQTAIPAVGATDQHAQLQLILEGPNDKVIVMARVERHEPEYALGDFEWQDFGAAFIKGRKLGEVINAQQQGTANALTARARPNATLKLRGVDAETLGELILGLEVATTYAGWAFGVNAYDQPAVELGKRMTREMLGG